MTARSAPLATPRDPLAWCALIAAGFLALVLHRLAIPSKPMFDEIHYLPAARALLAGTELVNREHPPLGKEILALSIHWIGDNPWGWRLPQALLGACGLFAAMRALWWASLSRPATLLFGVLLATNFAWYIQSRIAMLDMAMAALLAAALWQCALACRRPGRGRLHLALAGLFLGLSLAAKWSGAPLLALPGLTLAVLRWRAAGWRRFLIAPGVGPAPSVSLAEAAVWLGLVPVLVYLATYWPTFGVEWNPLSFTRLIPHQAEMIALQDSVIKPHPYQSRWWQWLFNIRPIWYLYESTDGAQRGVLLLGNPLTMLAGLPAILACAFLGVRGRVPGSAAMLAVAVLFGVSLGFWAVNSKPIQFYYHYLLPGTFLMAGLALAIAAVPGRWTPGRWPAWAMAAASAGFFVWFFPILSAGKLPNDQAFLTYTWLDSWR